MDPTHASDGWRWTANPNDWTRRRSCAASGRCSILRALEWLETAWRLRNPGLEYLKTDPLMDPMQQEPRFRAVMQALKFPN
jgi:hypothetical protein